MSMCDAAKVLGSHVASSEIDIYIWESPGPTQGNVCRKGPGSLRRHGSRTAWIASLGSSMWRIGTKQPFAAIGFIQAPCEYLQDEQLQILCTGKRDINVCA